MVAIVLLTPEGSFYFPSVPFLFSKAFSPISWARYLLHLVLKFCSIPCILCFPQISFECFSSLQVSRFPQISGGPSMFMYTKESEALKGRWKLCVWVRLGSCGLTPGVPRPHCRPVRCQCFPRDGCVSWIRISTLLPGRLRLAASVSGAEVGGVAISPPSVNFAPSSCFQCDARILSYACACVIDCADTRCLPCLLGYPADLVLPTSLYLLL